MLLGVIYDGLYECQHISVSLKDKKMGSFCETLVLGAVSLEFGTRRRFFHSFLGLVWYLVLTF